MGPSLPQHRSNLGNFAGFGDFAGIQTGLVLCWFCLTQKPRWPLEVAAKDPAAPLEATAKDPSGSNSHCLEHFSGIAVDTRPAPPILVFIVVFIFCPLRAPHSRVFQDGSAGSAVYGTVPQGMTGFGFFGISVSLPEPWCEVTEPSPGVPRVYFQLKSP